MIVSHLDEQLIEKGDIVVGTLPIHIVAQVCAKQAHYYHLTLNLSECHRGKELTVDELESLGATLKSYFAESL